jgi:hypothetical protein
MKVNLTVLMFLLFLGISTTAFSAIFTGKVIDADTKEPIEGAVVVASWQEETATVAGPSTKCKDVNETLTNKNGEWIIQGPRGRTGGSITALFTLLTGTYFTNPPQFIVFKPGYCSWPEGFMIDACKQGIRPGGQDKVAEGISVELPKLSNKEARLRSIPSTGCGKLEKQKKLIQLINEERTNLVLKGRLQAE